jgi:UDP-glucose 4-epimerase
MTAIRSALVIGGTGFIGSALLRRLASDGVNARALVLRNRTSRPPAAGEPLAAASSSVEDLAAAFSGTHFDAVFHLAAAGVAPSERFIEPLLEGNAGLLTRVLEALAQSPPDAFIYAGTCSEYSHAQPGTLIGEEWPTLPNDLYGAAKAAATIIGTALARKLEMPFVTLRLFHVFGPGEASYRLVPSLICALRRSQKLKLTEGRQVRDFVYVEDVVDALLAAATRRLGGYQVFNVCSGRPATVREVASCLAGRLHRPEALFEFGALPYREGEAMWIAGNNEKFTAATGWTPRFSLEEGLESTVDWTGKIADGF